MGEVSATAVGGAASGVRRDARAVGVTGVLAGALGSTMRQASSTGGALGNARGPVQQFAASFGSALASSDKGHQAFAVALAGGLPEADARRLYLAQMTFASTSTVAVASSIRLQDGSVSMVSRSYFSVTPAPLPSPEAVNEQRTIDLGAATGGTFTVTLNGETTAPLAWNATAAEVQAALEALPSVQSGDVLVTGDLP